MGDQMGAVVFDTKTRTGYSLLADRPLSTAINLRVGDRWITLDTRQFFVLLTNGTTRNWSQQAIIGDIVFTDVDPFKTDFTEDTSASPEFNTVSGLVQITAGQSSVAVVDPVVRTTAIVLFSINSSTGPDATATSFTWEIPSDGHLVFHANQNATGNVLISFTIVRTDI